MYPVFIPSKGRPHQRLFFELPEATIVVEPQDREAYLKANPNGRFKILPEDNRGIGYARQQILEGARRYGHERTWLIDDDLNYFYHHKDKKSIKLPPRVALEEAEKIFRNMPNVGQASLEGCQFAWASTKAYRSRSHCEACVCINVSNTKQINFRPELRMKEDIDFSMQILRGGLDNIRVQSYSFSCPTVGTRPGGLKPLYDQEYEIKACEKILEIWGPEFCQIRRKSTGKIDVKVNWRKLAKVGNVPPQDGKQSAPDSPHTPETSGSNQISASSTHVEYKRELGWASEIERKRISESLAKWPVSKFTDEKSQ